jgi:prevent-host-death family protein
MPFPPVNIFEAKSRLSRLVEAVESGKAAEIIIARNGKPVARLVPIRPVTKGPRIGIAEGEFIIPDPDPAEDERIAALFNGETRKSGRKAKR